MADIDRLLPAGFSESDILSCRVFTVEGKPSHFGCLFRRHDAPERRRPWRIQRYPGTERPSGLGVVGLSYAIDGRARFRDHADGWHDLSAGSIFQVRQARTPDEEPPVTPEAGFLEASVFFEPRLAARLARLDVLDLDFSAVHLPVAADLVTAYVNLLRAMEDHAVTTASALRKAIHLLDLTYEHVRLALPEAGYIDEACRLLSENVQPSYTAESAAEAVGVPYETFRRKFRKAVGIAPGEYQVRERISRAIALLQNHSVQEVAAKLGYANTSFFSRQFKAQVGLTPKHFKQQKVPLQPRSAAARGSTAS